MAEGTKYADLSDVELIHLIKQRDENALWAFHNRKKRKLLFLTYDIIKDKQGADSIVTTAFFEIWNMSQNLSTVADFEAVLYTICQRRAYDFNRNKIRSQVRSVPVDEFPDSDSAIDDSDTSINLINRAEVYNALFEAIQQLPSRQKEVVIYMMKNKNTAQISELMAISTATVRALRHNAIKSIQERLYAKQLISIILVLISTVMTLINKYLHFD